MSWPFFLRTLTPRRLLAAAGLFSLAMLSGAWVAQYGFGLYPCHLCMLQRYPYIAVVTLAVMAYWRFTPRWQVYAAAVCGLLFIADAGIAFYHAGVEQEWFAAPDSCSSASAGGETLEDLRRQIMEAPLVSCSQAMAYVFGLSLAAWNFLFAALAAIGMGFALKRLWKGIS